MDSMNNQSNETSATLANRVYRTLQTEITSGQIRPGQRLVRREIAHRLGVSPIPVIEALLRLEQDGLVESKPNCGARARAITPETIVNECMLREALECQVARLVAESATNARLGELEASARRLDSLMKRADPNSVIGMEMHMELHLQLAALAGFPLLEQELRSIWVRHLMQINWLNATLDPVPEGWHGLLVAALASRDADKAEKAMREHVRYGQHTLSEAIRRLTAPNGN
jgi:DNA-binding GntR family transcriptional regulator